MRSQPAKKDRELQATAYHEAAHAVVALRLGLKFRHVTIKPGSDCLGHLMCSRLPKWFNPEINKGDRVRMLAERHIIVDFAGQIAETRFLGSNPRFGMHEDNYHAVDLALYFCGSRKTWEAYLDYCFEASRDIVNSQLRVIEATATVLLVRQTLSYRDVLGLDMDALRNSPWPHCEKLSANGGGVMSTLRAGQTLVATEKHTLPEEIKWAARDDSQRSTDNYPRPGTRFRENPILGRT
jgi:hypothetical protein